MVVLCIDLEFPYWLGILSEKANNRLVVEPIGELFGDNQVDRFYEPAVTFDPELSSLIW
jgi:hypothetical protein